MANKYYKLLCNLPWNTWNERNKKLYLFMLMNSNEGLSITCYGVKFLNLVYLMHGLKTIYSLGCVVAKMK
ncbi:unnamed protein product [Acanthoscelides obtectus]|uniref:Uncharacterized protein n=1 Tax=Acanthoscelides obtectus TaxID=200917 RepID=A0A9P0KWB9_ACAOB|nr:unnamed protein product [Acanthoscelides obtectus]CAK1654577.1 hypothetical protein AOBTE_LOCUS18689 [Acanthoscelides obtectus]